MHHVARMPYQIDPGRSIAVINDAIAARAHLCATHPNPAGNGERAQACQAYTERLRQKTRGKWYDV